MLDVLLKFQKVLATDTQVLLDKAQDEVVVAETDR